MSCKVTSLMCVLVMIALVASVCGRCGRRDSAWTIGFVYGPDPFQMRAPDVNHNDSFPCIKNPIISCNSITEASFKAATVSSPHVFMPQGQYGKWFMFLEATPGDTDAHAARHTHSKITVSASANQGQSWKHAGIALNMPFDLYSPLVFMHENIAYMIPGTGAGGNLSLYRLSFMPTGWERVGDISSTSYSNVEMIFHEDFYWIFANRWIPAEASSTRVELDLFFAKSPLGPWTEHPNNRGSVSHKLDGGVRTAGRLIYIGDKLYLFSQRLINGQFQSVGMFEVTKLSPTEPMTSVFVPAFQKAIQHLGQWSVGRLQSVDFHAVIDNEGKQQWLGYLVGDGKSSGPRNKLNIPFTEETFDQRLYADEHCYRHGSRTANAAKFKKTDENKLIQVDRNPIGIKNYQL